MKIADQCKAAVLRRTAPHLESMVGKYKNQLFYGLHGQVLELGPGTGVNFEHLPQDISWNGIEPNTELWRDLRSHPKAPKHVLLRNVQDDGSLPLPSDSINHVVCTFVLCSVEDPRFMISEVLRVLKPGGSFRIMEHIASPPKTFKRHLQNMVTPFTRIIAGNCHTNRQTDLMIRTAGFRQIEVVSNFELPVRKLPLHFPVIALKATKNN